MIPRITINKSKDGEFEIWLNESGRDLLVMKLNELSEGNDHFHLGPPDEYNEVPLSRVAYNDTDELFDWGKVLFRLDQWDAQYFPHVVDKSE